jgi:hypothetical protein
MQGKDRTLEESYHNFFFYYIWSKKSFVNWIKISTIIKARRKIKEEEEEESVALQSKLNAILINMQELNMMATFFPLRNRLCNRVLSGIWHCSTIILLRIFKYFLILNYFFICFYCFDILKINILKKKNLNFFLKKNIYYIFKILKQKNKKFSNKKIKGKKHKYPSFWRAGFKWVRIIQVGLNATSGLIVLRLYHGERVGIY